jgi:glycosyltransferase involved in cell wall biosynthesis
VAEIRQAVTMRILQLHTRYRLHAGEDSVVDTEADALRRGGHEVRQLIVENPSDPTAAVAALVRSLHNRPVAARVRTEIAAFSPDVVHIHNTWFAMSSSAIRAATEAGAPTVMTVHNYRLGCISADLFRDGDVCTACVGRSPIRGVLHGCYRDSRVLSAVHATEVSLTRSRRVLDQCVDRFVAPSQFFADRLVDLGVPADRLVVKPHFAPDPGPRPHPPSAATDVLFVGRLAAGKGVDTLLAAWPTVERAEGTRLSIIGDGPLRADLARSNVDGVDIAGWQERTEVRSRMLTARAVIMPSEWYEPFGMVLIEAMGAGLPIIVTTMAAARDIVGPGAIVVPPRRPDALAIALSSLDDATLDELGALNRRRYEECYTEATGLAELESLYVSVMGATRP